MEAPADLPPPLDELPDQQVDYRKIANTLDKTLHLIQQSGLLLFN